MVESEISSTLMFGGGMRKFTLRLHDPRVLLIYIRVPFIIESET